MQKMYFVILLLVIITLLILIFVLPPAEQNYSTGSVCVSNNCFSVEVAKTKAQIERGLMFRKSLDKNKGMLFIFEKEGTYPFWMKNTLIPLDIIWLDSNGKIVYIKENAQPCHSLVCLSIVPSAKAKYVLEINAGLCQELGIKVENTLDLYTKGNDN